MQLFADHGVRGTSLIAVAENAGFSRGAVHGNFSDKDELDAAVVAFVIENLGPELARTLTFPASTNDRLADYISTHIDYCRRKPTRAAAIIAAVGYLGRKAGHAQSYGQRSTDSVADLVALFEEGQTRGEMRSFDATTMALSLRAVLDTAVPTHTNIDAGDVIALFDHATRAPEASQCAGTTAPPFAADSPTSMTTRDAGSGTGGPQHVRRSLHAGGNVPLHA